MEFRDKYCFAITASLPENKDKIGISNDAFAIGEIIERLINKIENARISLMR
jgi:hypothetical protein